MADCAIQYDDPIHDILLFIIIANDLPMPLTSRISNSYEVEWVHIVGYGKDYGMWLRIDGQVDYMCRGMKISQTKFVRQIKACNGVYPDDCP